MFDDIAASFNFTVLSSQVFTSTLKSSVQEVGLWVTSSLNKLSGHQATRGPEFEILMPSARALWSSPPEARNAPTAAT